MPYYIKDPKRDPNFDNHPYRNRLRPKHVLDRFRVQACRVSAVVRVLLERGLGFRVICGLGFWMVQGFLLKVGLVVNRGVGLKP